MTGKPLPHTLALSAPRATPPSRQGPPTPFSALFLFVEQKLCQEAEDRGVRALEPRELCHSPGRTAPPPHPAPSG